MPATPPPPPTRPPTNKHATHLSEPQGYISLELQLGEVERCRKLYAKYLEAMPYNCQVLEIYVDICRIWGSRDIGAIYACSTRCLSYT